MKKTILFIAILLISSQITNAQNKREIGELSIGFLLEGDNPTAGFSFFFVNHKNGGLGGYLDGSGSGLFAKPSEDYLYKDISYNQVQRWGDPKIQNKDLVARATIGLTLKTFDFLAIYAGGGTVVKEQYQQYRDPSGIFR